MIRETFINRANRDSHFKKLRYRKPIRYTLSDQNYHPMYVKDYESETGDVLKATDKGFGNAIYRTYFSKLYVVEAR